MSRVAPVKSTDVKSAEVKSAAVRSALERLAPINSAEVKSAAVRYIPERLAPINLGAHVSCQKYLLLFRSHHHVVLNGIRSLNLLDKLW